jgi:hypothetical protein
MASSLKKVADHLDILYGGGSIYYRFDVRQGLDDISLSDWKEASLILAHTCNYLHEECRQIDLCVRTLHAAFINSSPIPSTGDRTAEQAPLPSSRDPIEGNEEMRK